MILMMIFNAPPLLMLMLFGMREMPRFEIPSLPRPSTAPRGCRRGPAAQAAEQSSERSRGMMRGNPMNIPPVSIAAAKAALIEQYADPMLRRRASMLWGTPRRRQILDRPAGRGAFRVPLVDLRLTTIEPVDIRGAIYADDALAKTVWFPPEILPSPDSPTASCSSTNSPPPISGCRSRPIR